MPYLLRKLLLLLFTAWVAISLNFALPRLMPGDPVGVRLSQSQGRLGPEAVEALRIAYGLDQYERNIFVQYADYIGRLARGDFGRSISYFPAPALEVVGRAAPWTLGLVGVTTIIAFAIGTLLGLLSAWWRGTWLADAIVPIAIFLNTVPYFWFALLALYFFAFRFYWFPLGGGYSTILRPGLTPEFVGSILEHAVLPGLTIIVTAAGGWLLTMRNNVVTVLGQDYVAFARAKGLPTRRLLSRYVAKNAILPSLTGFAMALGFVVGGSILTEIVFSYPGLGALLYTSVLSLDYPLMQAVFLFIALGVLLANFVADLVYHFLDPRVRVEGA